ncbi:MAG: Hsp70 family protein [Pirellulales bacterium]|nr:Hsp70 family protein [Pirellulales bacterium]
MANPTPAIELALEETPSRYVVGIDLGTTNSAVCYVDTTERPWRVRVLEIPQLVAPGQIEARDTLPSFLYQPPAADSPMSEVQSPKSSNRHDLGPWTLDFGQSPYIVGFMARDYGAAAPGRLIASAKSWLCHTGVDRTAELLPWHAAPDVERISPVEASSRYLAHLRSSWNNKFKTEPLERQDVVLTLPASFDEIARELTVEAAARAGLSRVVLIEEPQAAFYAWIYKHQRNWDELVTPGQKILVCDIGGGTTDFTLIRVRRGEDGKIQFHRVAVGDHLILGGDNMDLALAQHLEGRLGKLAPRQWDLLLRQSRQVKEQMLSPDAPEQLTVALPGTGSKLIGGGLSAKVTRDEVRQLLVDGFMPRVRLSDKPAARRSGFQEFGLPYAAEAAMTRYLAAFLMAHRFAGDDVGQASRLSGHDHHSQHADPARPDAVLFNGGVFESPLLKARLLDCLTDWFAPPTSASSSSSRSPQPPAPQVLDNDRLDLAVARGAAYYGMVRRGEGVRIVASLARTYYIGVEADDAVISVADAASIRMPGGIAADAGSVGHGGVGHGTAALCLVPGNAEPGQTIELIGRQFDLLVSEPVEFPLYTSSVRLTDRPGELVAVDPEQMTALPPIRTALRTRSRRERGTVAVRLFAKLTEIGTLELWCREVGGDRTWRLQFDVRSATQTDVEAHETAAESQGFVDEATAESARQVLAATFASSGSDDPGPLVKRLVAAIGSDRHEWPTSLLRRIWEMLMELEPGRRKSPAHEARWLNLLGYSLRPGYGLAVDDWRVAETWKTVQGKLAHAAATSRTESLILWRRIAGGLTQGQQRALAEPLLATVRTLHKRHTGGGQGSDPTFQAHEALEVLRLLGALELLAVEVKIELGRLLLDLSPKKKLSAIRPAIVWAVARLGARQPAYGPLNTVIPPAEASDWLDRLQDDSQGDAITQFAVVNLARRTGDRFRDTGDAARGRVLQWLDDHRAGEHARKLVAEGGELAREEQDRVFGEQLPKGLRLR